MEINILNDKKEEILKNISYAKEAGINKISAIIIIDNDVIKKELISWLIDEGYKVSLTRDEVDILNVEW